MGPVLHIAASDDLTAISTLVLAVMALGLAAAVVALVRATRAGTAQARIDARAELTVLERHMSTGYRPLLIDVRAGESAEPSFETAFPGLEPQPLDPGSVFVAFEAGSVYVSVPVRNAGHGVAIIGEDGIEMAGPFLGPLKYRTTRGKYLPVGETARVEVIAVDLRRESARERSAMSGLTWQLSVPYGDFASRQQTAARLSIVCQNDDVAGPWRVERVEQEPRHDESPAVDSPTLPDPLPSTETPESGPVDSGREKAGVRNEPVVDVWGKPVGPKRRRR